MNTTAKNAQLAAATDNDLRWTADTAIRFAIGECSLGSILVAASERGVCTILLGDDPDELAHDLRDRFPRAKVIGGDGEFEQIVSKVVAFVEAPAAGIDLPLDVRGTAFQQRVWQALRKIPAGETAKNHVLPALRVVRDLARLTHNSLSDSVRFWVGII